MVGAFLCRRYNGFFHHKPILNQTTKAPAPQWIRCFSCFYPAIFSGSETTSHSAMANWSMYFVSRNLRRYVHNVHSKAKTTQFRAFLVCTYVFFDVHRRTQCTQGTFFSFFGVYIVYMCVHAIFFMYTWENNAFSGFFRWCVHCVHVFLCFENECRN